MRRAPAMAEKSRIYLSEWLTHRLIKQYIETFSDETWPAVVKWTFVLGILALRNGGFPLHRLSLADLKAIAKRNGDDLVLPAVQAGLLQLACSNTSSRKGKKGAAGETDATSRESDPHPDSGGEEASLKSATRATALVLAKAADLPPPIESCPGRRKGQKNGDTALAPGRSRITEGATIKNRRRTSSWMAARSKNKRRFCSAEESKKRCPSERSASKRQPQQHDELCLLQPKPSSSWRSGDPSTFPPLRGPYRGEKLPRPQRISPHADRTYPQWWGDYFSTCAPEMPSPEGVAEAIPRRSLETGSKPAVAHKCENNLLLPFAVASEPWGEEHPTYPSGIADFVPASVQQDEQQQVREQQLSQACCPQSSTGEVPLSLCVSERFCKVCGESRRNAEGHDEDVTTAATAAATPKFGAPSSAPAFRKAHAARQKTRDMSQLCSTPCGGAGPARNCRDENHSISPSSRRSYCSLASPLSLSGLLRESHQSKQQEREQLFAQAPQPCAQRGSKQQRQLCNSGRRQPQPRRGCSLSVLQQQRRLRQRALHRSASAPRPVVIDGFQNFRPAAEAQWICTLRPAAHRHVCPSNCAVAAGTRSSQPFLPPLTPLPRLTAAEAVTQRRRRLPVGRNQPAQGQRGFQQHFVSQNQHVHQEQRRISRGGTQNCRFERLDLESEEMSSLTASDLPRNAVHPDMLLHVPLPRGEHCCGSQCATNKKVESAAHAKPYGLRRLAAAVDAARAAAAVAPRAATDTAAAPSAEKMCSPHYVVPDNLLNDYLRTEHSSQLPQDCITITSPCNYSSFFDAALAAYTGAAHASTLQSPGEDCPSPRGLLGPPLNQRFQRRYPFVHPTAAIDAVPKHCQLGALGGADDVRAPELEALHTEFAATDAANNSSPSRCSTSESSFSLSSVYVDEKFADAAPAAQTSCTCTAAADVQQQLCRQHALVRQQERVKQEQQIGSQEHGQCQREGIEQHPIQMHFARHEEDDTEGHASGGQYDGPFVAKQLDNACCTSGQEAATADEILQLYFTPELERAAALQQRREWAAQLPVDAARRRRVLLQQSV